MKTNNLIWAMWGTIMCAIGIIGLCLDIKNMINLTAGYGVFCGIIFTIDYILNGDGRKSG